MATNQVVLKSSNCNNYIIIPARLASTRLPNKLLLDETGYPLIWHTIQRALESNLAYNIIVATEDKEIASVVEQFAIPRVSVVMTGQCRSGTERISVVCRTLHDPNIIINFQGDEPELPGKYADWLIAVLNEGLLPTRENSIATIASPATEEEASSPSVVKVTITQEPHTAMYFSRSHIPFNGPALKHFGLYGYKSAFFGCYPSAGFNTRYHSESLEQLAWLENKWTIRVLVKDRIDCVGIDTRKEYDDFVKRWKDSK